MATTLYKLKDLCDGPVQIAINSWRDHFPTIEQFLLDAMINGTIIDADKERMMCHHQSVVEVYFKPKVGGDLIGVLHYDIELALQQAYRIAMNKRNASCVG